MQVVKPNKKGIELAAKLLKAGRAVVYPTDTSYGLAVDATRLRALRRMYKIKKRRLYTMPTHIVVSSLSQAKQYGFFNKTAERIFKKFLPGPLTVIVPIKKKFASSKVLAGGAGTIGLRIPKNKLALTLVKKLKRPITATSANPSSRHGGHDSYSPEDVVNQFQNRQYQPDLILDAGQLKRVKPSTMLDLTGKRVRILRQGPISLKEINHILPSQT